MEVQNVERKKPREVPSVQVGSSYLMADFNEPDDIFFEKAKNELRETPDVVEQALKEIRVLVEGEPDLCVPDDDEFYIKFLRPCKWYSKSALGLMKRFYQFRVKHPRYCENLVPSKQKSAFSSNIFMPMPDRTPDGCRILVINGGKRWNPKITSLDELFRATVLSLEAAMTEPKTQIAGVHVILNMDGFTLTHVTYLTPSFAGMLTDWIQRCLPCRLKGIHIVNQPFVFNMAFAIFKPFLQEKTRNRIHFHGKDRTALIAQLSAKALPTFVGGELMCDEMDGDSIWRYFCWFEKDFIESSKYGYAKNTK